MVNDWGFKFWPHGLGGKSWLGLALKLPYDNHVYYDPEIKGEFRLGWFSVRS